MLWFIIFFITMVFIGGVSDILNVRTQIQEIRKIVQTAVLSASKYYIQDNNITLSEEMATNIIQKIPLYQKIEEDNIDIEFRWYIDDIEIDYENEIPNNVRASITGYGVDMFWFRLAQWKEYIVGRIEAKANIVGKPTDELPIIDEVSDFMPFAINECGQETILPEQSYSFIYKSYDIYENNESTGFYGLRDSEPDRSKAQNDFADFKNELFDFNRITTKQYLVNSLLSSINNDSQQMASALKISDYEEPLDITIALIDCNSTKDNIIISNLIPVSMTNIYCGDKKTSEENIEKVFNDQTGELFDNINWVEWVESKDCSASGLFRIDIDIKPAEKESVLLEY